jgi:hypothetical protein
MCDVSIEAKKINVVKQLKRIASDQVKINNKKCVFYLQFEMAYLFHCKMTSASSSLSFVLPLGLLLRLRQSQNYKGKRPGVATL